MIIQEMGTEITEVPGIDFIRVERDAASERNVHVLVKWIDRDEPISFGIKEFEDLTTALNLTNDRAQWLAERNEAGQ